MTDNQAKIREEAGLREALTPSEGTKAAYIGEFSISFPDINEEGQEPVNPYRKDMGCALHHSYELADAWDKGYAARPQPAPADNGEGRPTDTDISHAILNDDMRGVDHAQLRRLFARRRDG